MKKSGSTLKHLVWINVLRVVAAYIPGQGKCHQGPPLPPSPLLPPPSPPEDHYGDASLNIKSLKHAQEMFENDRRGYQESSEV